MPPLWPSLLAKSRRPAYPRIKGQQEADVVIVGGGLTGCASALAFATAGVKTVVLEGQAIGMGSTAGHSGVIRAGFEESFQETADAIGLRGARLLWQGTRRASLDFAAALRRLQARCDLAPAQLLDFTHADPAAVRVLKREYQARRDAGLEARWVTALALQRQSRIQGGGGIRTDGFTMDPYRACLALARAAEARGAAIYERSGVRRIRAARTHVEVAGDQATIRCQSVILTTLGGIRDLRALARHVESRDRYTVVTEPLPAAVRREVGERHAVLRDAANPPHLLRWLRDDRVLFSGGDQAEVPARSRERALVQRTGQLMYELSLLYPAISGLQAELSWAAPHLKTSDGLPFIGPHRNFPKHFFALGSIAHGAGGAWLAARAALRHFTGEPARGDDFLGFARVL